MSGLEFVAVLGIASSAIEVVGACTKVIERIRQYGHSIAFKDLKTQLQLFSKEIGHLSDPVEHFDVDPTTEAILSEVLKGCRRQLEKMDMILQSVIPVANSSRLKRTFYGVRSVSKEKEIREVLSILSSYQASIMLHLSRRNVQITAQIPRLISLLEDKILPDGSQILEPAQNQTEVISISEISTFAIPQPRQLRNRQDLKKASKCYQGICNCPCHLSRTSIPMSWMVTGVVRGMFCGCDNQEYSMAMRLFRTFCMLKLSMNWQDGISISCALQFYGIVKDTSPGFMILYKCGEGLMSFKEAREELRMMRVSGEINFKEVDRSGDGWIERLLSRPWPIQVRNIQFGLLDTLFQEGAIVSADRILKSCIAWGSRFWEPQSYLILLKHLLALGIDPCDAGLDLCRSWPAYGYLVAPGSEDVDDPMFIRAIAILAGHSLEFGSTTPLHSAVMNNDFTKVISLLGRGNDSVLVGRNFLGRTALHFAIQNPKMVSCLIEHGFSAHIDAEDGIGTTPLMYAAAYNQYESALILINYGAKPDVTDKVRHFNFLDYAMWRHNYSFIRRYASEYLSLKCTDSREKILDASLWNYMLTYALQMRDSDSEGLQCLLQLRGNCDMTSKIGNTPLHLARSSLQVMLLLNHSRFDLNQPNSRGQTPLMRYCRFYDPLLVQRTINEGVFINFVDRNQMNALQHATYNLPITRWGNYEWENWVGALNIFAALLVAGADECNCALCVCPCSTRGCTPTSFILYYRYSYCDRRLCSQLPWQIEWFLLLRHLRGSETLRQTVQSLFRFQKFEELGMTHTCCVARSTGERDPWEDEMDEMDCTIDDDVTAIGTVEDIQEILDEQEELRQVLDGACSEFETRTGYSEEELWIGILARRAIFFEEAEKKWKDRPVWKKPSLEDLKVRYYIVSQREYHRLTENRLQTQGDIEIITENPLRLINHKRDRIEDWDSGLLPSLAESDCTLESRFREFLNAVEMKPLYENSILPSKFDRVSWHTERKRLIAVLLEEAEKIRQTPAESRDWDFDSLRPDFSWSDSKCIFHF